MKIVNVNIKKVRLKLNYSQQEFANALKLQRNTVSLLENGKRFPSDRTIFDICNTFNVNVNWLKNDEGEMFINKDNGDDSEVANLKEKICDEINNLTHQDLKVLKKATDILSLVFKNNEK